MFYGPEYGLSWCMFHMNLRRIQLLLDEVVYRCQLYPVDGTVEFNYVLTDFFSCCIIEYSATIIILNNLFSVRSIKNKKNKSFNFTFTYSFSDALSFLCSCKFLTYIIFLLPRKLFLKNIYLFIWLCQVLVVAHGIFVDVCGTFVAACGIFSCSMWDL